LSFYRIGEFNVVPGMEEQFEDLVRQLFTDTRDMATERVQVQLIRSTDDPSHYVIVGLWKSDTQWDVISRAAERRRFTETLRMITHEPAGGEWFEVVIHEA